MKLTDKDIQTTVAFDMVTQQWLVRYAVCIQIGRGYSHHTAVPDEVCLRQKRDLVRMFEDEYLDDELLTLKRGGTHDPET
jgi:hypothetical protein